MSERKREGELLREGLGTRDVTVRVALHACLRHQAKTTH